MEMRPKVSNKVDVTKKNSLRKSIHEFISETLKKDEILDSDWDTLLDFVEQSVKICRDVLVSSSRNTAVTVPNYTHGFVLWLVQSLLTAITKATSRLLQSSISNCLHIMFNITKSRDNPMFCYLLKKTVHFLTDLAELYKVASAQEVFEYPVLMSHFEYAPTKDEIEVILRSTDCIHPRPGMVELHNLPHLSALLRHSLLSLEAFSSELVMFCPGVTDKVYSALCSVLKFGDLEVKEVGLCLLEKLVKSCVFSSLAGMDNVLWTLIALVNLCTKLLSEDHWIIEAEFQQKLVSCLRLFFCASDGEQLSVLRFWDHLSSSLILLLTSSSYSLAHPDLQLCLGELLHKCCLMNPPLPSFSCETIVDRTGHVNNMQPLVPTLCHLVRQEISSKNTKKCPGEQSQGGDCAKSDASKLKSCGFHIRQRAVYLARQIVDLSLGQLNAEHLVCWLEGLRAVVDIHSRLEPGVWWSASDVDCFCRCWERSVNHALFLNDSVFDTTFYQGLSFVDKVLSVIIDSIGAIFFSAGLLKLTDAVTNRLVSLIVLPWPQEQQEGVNSSLIDTQLLRDSLYLRPEQKDAPHCKSSSLFAVAALPRNQNELKLSCFKSVLSDGNGVLSSLVKALPLLFDSLPLDNAANILEMLSSANDFKDPNVQSMYINEVPAMLLTLSQSQLSSSSYKGGPTTGFCHPVHYDFRLDVCPCECTVSKQLLEWVVQPVLGVSEPWLLRALLKCLFKVKSLFVLVDSSLIDRLFLKLFTHYDPSVLAVISSSIEQLFCTGDNSSSTEETEQHPVILRLKEAYQQGGHGNVKLQEFTVTAFGQICRFSKDNLFTTCLLALLKFYLEPSMAVKSAAYVQIQRLAEFLKLPAKKLLSRHKESICRLIVSLIHESKQTTTPKKQSILYQMAKLFQVELSKFFKITEDVMVPLLVCRATSASLSALKVMAAHLEINTGSLVVDCFMHIFLHMIQRGGQKELQTVSSFLKSTFEFEMTDLLRSASKNILNLLVLHLSTHRERMLSGVQMLAEIEPGTKTNSIQYLEPHLLGVIAYFNITLVRVDVFENSSFSLGVLALESLIELMELMGAKHITDVKMKIITMLRHCLTFKDSELICVTLRAWNSFIHCVELNSLGPLLGQIVVALSPFVKQYPQAVSTIFNFLIVENRTVLSPFFNEIYLLPETPEMAEVSLVLKEHSETPRSLHEQLRHLLKGVAQERSDITRDALKSLHSLLKSSKVELQKYMVGSDTVDPIITEIIRTMLLSLRGADVELREQYGKCFGELGAIDPGKLDIPIARETRVVKYYEVDGDFVVDLLGELSRAYLAASNTRSQDCCAFAIQEILKLFDCKSIERGSEGARIWERLTEECQEVLRPHLNSNYSANLPDLRQVTHPIFKLSKKASYHIWLHKWSSYLVHKLQEGIPRSVFSPCSIIFQHDKSIAQYLLPYILTCLLTTCSSDVSRKVLGEMMAVLKSCVSNHDILADHADFTNMCAQTIFSLLDHLTAWASAKNKAHAVRKAKALPMKGNHEEVEKVSSFLDRVPKENLAHAAFRCQAYTRALMYLELHLQEDSTCLRDNLGFLLKVYVSLGDSDSIAGAAVLRTADPELSELTLQYECTGNYRDAAACYEKVIQTDRDNISSHEGLLRCMIRQGEFASALMHVKGLQASKPVWMKRLNSYRVEAAWNLGQWDILQEHLSMEMTGSKNWNVNLGRLLLTAKHKDVKTFLSRLSKVRMEQMGPLCTASLEQGSYQRAYEYIVRLHMLQELEEGVMHFIVNKDSVSPGEEMFIKNWEARFQLLQESFRTQEPILSLRRVILGIESKNDLPVGKYWLRSASIARRDGYLQTALSFLLNARDYSLPEYYMERAEYENTQVSSYEALHGLQKSVSEKWPDVSTPFAGTGDKTHAEALLLIGKWMEDTAHCDTQTVLKQYKNVITVMPEFEDGHFYLGKYYDRLMTVLASHRPRKSGEFLLFIVRHYGNTLQYGSKFLYQCMPRLLTLWLDFGSNVPDQGKKSQERNAMKITLAQLNELIKTNRDRLPPYQFLIAFPQLISRICHPNTDVFAHLETIVLKLLKYFPQQALWMMVAVSKSTHADRKSRCDMILTKAKKELPLIGKLIDDMLKLSDRLLELCNKHIDTGKNTMDRVCRNLPRLISNSKFSSIMVPLQSSLTVTLPGSYCESYEHDPFPGDQPTIVQFEDQFEVLASLQRPKKITVIANDGKSYILLCKPKDDLRKDARLMEFNTVVNKCLRKDQNSRQRQLHIRTYAVVPLNEECGLLEWVPNTIGLRNILSKLYQEKGTHLPGRELKEIYKDAGKDPKKLKELFLKKLLPKHPAVFGEWFLRTFPDPTSWYSSRQSYAHTAAVMSIVGYVLGLGDRHGENILFDSTSGDCVHVDFNCLFNRGETFDVPEVVPFRLTHNMVHGMGVTGYEGMFRKSCETTMKVLRQECDALMCVLKTFIHDPLVEWEKVKGRMSSDSASDKPLKIIQDIEDRLNGKYSQKTKGLPLSVEGQVDALIKEATDVDNLSRMYVGWAPFM
ncbi:serine/threonine-protein kinase ATR-like [Halichondria panicea]|uniref:serine/threonine-protein kinase ATR-like n=1 Tax=Halichondria panicea TaxID=6063 RepID=UPI00312BA196